MYRKRLLKKHLGGFYETMKAHNRLANIENILEEYKANILSNLQEELDKSLNSNYPFEKGQFGLCTAILKIKKL